MKYLLRFFFTFCFVFLLARKIKTPSMRLRIVSSFNIGEKVATVNNKEIDEASGLVMSRNNPNTIWTHNDSGDEPRIFLISNKGKYLATYFIEGATNIDWEDISIANDNGINYLYVGDIGDNASESEVKSIYKFPEPTIDSTKMPIESSISNAKTIRFKYPDGHRDAECLMVDPITKDIIIISKREENVGIYLAPYPQSFTEVITLAKVGSLLFSGVVGGDISPDGKEILLKTYKKVLYWKKADNETIIERITNLFENLPYKGEPQGEAIAWDTDGKGYYTLSESPKNKPINLIYYKRK